MQLALEPETFVSAEASHRFVIAVNNYAAVVLVSPLLTAVAAAAPRIQLDLPPTGLRPNWAVAMGQFREAVFSKVPEVTLGV